MWLKARMENENILYCLLQKRKHFYGTHQDTEQSVEGNVGVVHRSTYLSHLHTFTFNVSKATRTRYQMYPNIHSSYPQTSCDVTLLRAAASELCPAAPVWVSPVRTGAVAARAGARQMGWAVATNGPLLPFAIFILCLPLTPAIQGHRVEGS